METRLKSIIIYLESKCTEKYRYKFELCSKYDRENDFDIVICRKLR